MVSTRTFAIRDALLYDSLYCTRRLIFTAAARGYVLFMCMCGERDRFHDERLVQSIEKCLLGGVARLPNGTKPSLPRRVCPRC
mgnify:FL=1